MTVNKVELETIFDNLASKKSRETFFLELMITADGFDFELGTPEKYVDELLQISIPKSNEGNKDKIRVLNHTLAIIAENSNNYEKAAHFHKQAGNIREAIQYARQAGLDKMVDEWAEEYIQAAQLEAPPNSGTDKIDNRAIEAAHRATELGLEEKAQQIVRNYLEGFSRFESDPEGHEARGDFAKQYGPPELAERFYIKAMLQFEEKGEYDCALRVARALDDPDKIKFYDTLRYLLADSKRRAQIDEERAEERDAQK